jgi:hypothetical protein
LLLGAEVGVALELEIPQGPGDGEGADDTVGFDEPARPPDPGELACVSACVGVCVGV